ncbi:hypothetical protein [Coxiella burnetii]|uniref:hypothetical protein n=1 Tax=Coxiella burnetii TaxID=777 RepID=UPI003EBDB91F
MDKEILEESGFRGGEIAKKSENIFEPNPKKRKSIPETHLDNDNLNYSLNKKEFSSDLFKKIVESMLPQINKQTKQYIAINQIKFEEINNEEHNALFPLHFGMNYGLKVTSRIEKLLKFQYNDRGAKRKAG